MMSTMAPAFAACAPLGDDVTFGDSPDASIDAPADTAPDVTGWLPPDTILDAAGEASPEVDAASRPDVAVDAPWEAAPPFDAAPDAEDADVDDASVQDASMEATTPDAAPVADAGPLSFPTCDAPEFGARVAAVAFAAPRSSQDTFGQDRMPGVVLGPPDRSVVTLGNGGSITLAFDAVIVDEPGVDFTVFENPFGTWDELATVSVSEDGVTFIDFPCTAKQTRTDPAGTDYGLCAGWHEVTNPMSVAGWTTADWTDPSKSGGDPYDLADLGLTAARFVRITDRADLVKTDDPTSPMADTFDLDAIALVHARCP